MGLRSRSSGLALAASFALGLGCRIPVGIDRKPGSAPRCANDVCVEVVHFGSGEKVIGMWIEAAPETRLVNAHFTIDDEPACGGHVPVEWVKVDDRVHPAGPVDVGGDHGVLLGFPINAWWAHSGYWRATFVDVDLDVAGRPRCVRTRLTRADGKEAVGQ